MHGNEDPVHPPQKNTDAQAHPLMGLGWGQALIFLFQALRWSECIVSVENLALCHPSLQNSHPPPLTSLSSLLPRQAVPMTLLSATPKSCKLGSSHHRGPTCTLASSEICPLLRPQDPGAHLFLILLCSLCGTHCYSTVICPLFLSSSSHLGCKLHGVRT